MYTTARERVMAQLLLAPNASAARIAQALGMTSPAVRHHLKVLCLEGVAISKGSTRSGRRGRPTKLYRIADALIGDNLAMVSDSLLQAWSRRSGPSSREDVVPVLARALVKRLALPAVGTSPSAKLKSLCDQLSAAHYEARWEAGAGGPRIILGHCPYTEIIQAHPELCRMDARALGEILGMTAVQTAKIDSSTPLASRCVFLLTSADRGGG